MPRERPSAAMRRATSRASCSGSSENWNRNGGGLSPRERVQRQCRHGKLAWRQVCATSSLVRGPITNCAPSASARSYAGSDAEFRRVVDEDSRGRVRPVEIAGEEAVADGRSRPPAGVRLSGSSSATDGGWPGISDQRPRPVEAAAPDAARGSSAVPGWFGCLRAPVRCAARCRRVAGCGRRAKLCELDPGAIAVGRAGRDGGRGAAALQRIEQQPIVRVPRVRRAEEPAALLERVDTVERATGQEVRLCLEQQQVRLERGGPRLRDAAQRGQRRGAVAVRKREFCLDPRQQDRVIARWRARRPCRASARRPLSGLPPGIRAQRAASAACPRRGTAASPAARSSLAASACWPLRARVSAEAVESSAATAAGGVSRAAPVASTTESSTARACRP